MPTAHFTITGEFITQHARDLMLEDEPGRAYRLIADCLVGSEDTGALARRLLGGKAKLVGDSVDGINVEDDDAQEYVKQLCWLYAGRVRLDKRWYRPRGVVLSWGPDDGRAACKVFGPIPTTLGPTASLRRFSQLRAGYYADDGERTVLVDDERWVIFEPCGDPPQWHTAARTPEQAVLEAKAAGRPLEELGAFPERSPRRVAELIIEKAELVGDAAHEVLDLSDEIEDAQHAAALERIGARVREQAGSDVFDLTLLDGRVVQVPRAPFTHWALCRLDPRPTDLPEWTLVSESGMKQAMDNPYHTDWMLGAGLPIADTHADYISRPAWAYASDLQIASVDRAQA